METCERHPSPILDACQLAINADVTGPADATKGLVSIFDIFVYVDQTLQGANNPGHK